MLKELHIENIAVIETADIEFNNGLNVLTGETGAGKSIIIDSINAVLGNRTSKDLIRTGTDNALVSAVFVSNLEYDWFKENDIDQGEEIILQRKINVDGKSSCRVNGIPVTATQLKELAGQLVDIYGQNEGLKLLDEKAHLGFLDNFSNNESIYSDYYREYRKLVSISREIKSLSIDEFEKERLSESLKNKINELSNAKIVDGEYESLKANYYLLHNSEKLKESLTEAIRYLSGIDNCAISDIQNATYHLQRANSISSDLNDTIKNLNEISFGINNVNETILDLLSTLDFSEDEFNEMENRINYLERLQRKYGCDELGLLQELENAYKQLDDIEYSEDKINKLSKEFEIQKNVVFNTAELLTSARKKGAIELEKQITSELRSLNMPSVKFKVDFQSLSKPTSNGLDDVKFLMSANAGEELGRISKIASGGELSRIMLAIKNVLVKNDIVSTMIFDEVDSGVSGISALRVAEKLYSVSYNKQVLCISHLPQIAAMADSQFQVRKSEKSGRTYTEVIHLSENERINEIARLYGGDYISDSTLIAAKDQLDKSKLFKESLKI